MAWVEMDHSAHPLPTSCYVQAHQPAEQAAQSTSSLALDREKSCSLFSAELLLTNVKVHPPGDPQTGRERALNLSLSFPSARPPAVRSLGRGFQLAGWPPAARWRQRHGGSGQDAAAGRRHRRAAPAAPQRSEGNWGGGARAGCAKGWGPGESLIRMYVCKWYRLCCLDPGAGGRVWECAGGNPGQVAVGWRKWLQAKGGEI